MNTELTIKFNVKERKAIEAVLWIIQNGETNMYNIFKILYAAEKFHLNNYGVPLTGDTFIAMDYGAVPSWLYNMIKASPGNIGFSKEKEDGFILKSTRGPNMRRLSESNIEALEHGCKEYAGLDFDAVKRKNHADPAWIKNYKRDYVARIPFEDLIEEEWLKEDLKIETQIAIF